jgi:Domain of unknown function (DUF222)
VTVSTTTRPTASIVDLLTDIHVLLDERPNRQHDGLPPGELARAVAEVDRAVSRLQSIKLSLVASPDATRASRDEGFVDTGAWLARHTRSGGAAAAGQVRMAKHLEQLPVTQETLASGEVSMAHASVISHTQRQLPTTLTAPQRDSVERKLVAMARQFDPETLRRRARRVLDDITTKEEVDRHHARQLEDEESAARAKTRLTLHDNNDGTVTGHFTVPALPGSILRKIMQQMTAPRRGKFGATPAQVGSQPELRDAAHRAGLAFAELLEHLPTDHLHTKVAATVVITMEHRQLLDDLAAAGVDTGLELSPAEARRIACGAGVLPAVLGGGSLALDLGRTQRLFNEPQRVALAIHHSSCAADGCERPYAWCELHHLDPWSTGGSTDLIKAVPLCSWHHQRMHDPAYKHRRKPDGTIVFHRRI